MAIASMTGFARTHGTAEGYHWVWEVRATNGRNLDVRPRVPAGLEALENRIRALVQQYVTRGSVSVSLQCRREGGNQVPVVNEDALEKILITARRLEQELGLAAPRIDGILGLKGVLEVVEPEDDPATVEARDTALMAGLEEALTALDEMRRREGAEIARVLSDTLGEMREKTTEAGNLAAAQPEAIKARFTAKLEEMLADSSAVNPDRLEQEVAILATKADVREELDRLQTHIKAGEDLLAEGGAVGRRLDFLAQEMNREANTLCAKSTDTELTRVGLDLKALVDQLREQVQNLE